MSFWTRWGRSLTALASGALLVTAGCGDGGGGSKNRPAKPVASTTLTITAQPSTSGFHRFNVRHLQAKAGLIRIRLVNGGNTSHNVRIHAGSKCCFPPLARDVGGTTTASPGEVMAGTVRLRPGRYFFLCSIGGHWNGDRGKMRGTLLVR